MALNFECFWPSQISGLHALKKLYPNLYASLAVRYVKTFRNVSPLGFKVILRHTLNFGPIFKLVFENCSKSPVPG